MINEKLAIPEQKALYGLIGIYQIYHISRPNLLYIGSASIQKGRIHRRGFYNRWLRHCDRLRNNNHHSLYLQRIVNKHGIEGVRFQIIKVCQTPEEVLKSEQFYLDTLQPKLNSLKIASSSLGFKHSPESKAKMSIAKRGCKPPVLTEDGLRRMKDFGKNRDLSYLRTPEMRIKQALASKNNKPPDWAIEKSRKPINQFDTNGNYLQTFMSVSEASRMTNTDRSSIFHCTTGKRVSCGGFKWSYLMNPTWAKNQGLSENRLDKTA